VLAPRTIASSLSPISGFQPVRIFQAQQRVLDERFSFISPSPIICCIAGLTQDNNSVTSSIDSPCKTSFSRRRRVCLEIPLHDSKPIDRRIRGEQQLDDRNMRPTNTRCADCNCSPGECQISETPANCPSCTLETCCCWPAVHSEPFGELNI